ncbi:MAG: thymidine kinase [Mesorhizobium sp.]|nr:MAG: thymidine kinase [Mesorhizobium sp.]
MAKLHFFYSVMNAGKSTHCLQAKWNYEENGGRTLLFTSAVDNRAGVGVVSSRLGLRAEAIALSDTDDLLDMVSSEHAASPVTAVLMDEVQFMTENHIHQASDVVDRLRIPVMAYGLKNNVRGELFSPAVCAVLALADQINEIKQLCHCGRKATMILRYSPDGAIDRSGPVVEVGGEGRYVSVCRPHFKSGDIGPTARSRLLEAAA